MYAPLLAERRKPSGATQFSRKPDGLHRTANNAYAMDKSIPFTPALYSAVACWRVTSSTVKRSGYSQGWFESSGNSV